MKKHTEVRLGKVRLDWVRIFILLVPTASFFS
jgi:hypothetical protein